MSHRDALLRDVFSVACMLTITCRGIFTSSVRIEDVYRFDLSNVSWVDLFSKAIREAHLLPFSWLNLNGGK
jgi:hypothetical protein